MPAVDFFRPFTVSAFQKVRDGSWMTGPLAEAIGTSGDRSVRKWNRLWVRPVAGPGVEAICCYLGYLVWTTKLVSCPG